MISDETYCDDLSFDRNIRQYVGKIYLLIPEHVQAIKIQMIMQHVLVCHGTKG